MVFAVLPCVLPTVQGVPGRCAQLSLPCAIASPGACPELELARVAGRSRLYSTGSVPRPPADLWTSMDFRVYQFRSNERVLIGILKTDVF